MGISAGGLGALPEVRGKALIFFRSVHGI
jgi:hypothetical protein